MKKPIVIHTPSIIFWVYFLYITIILLTPIFNDPDDYKLWNEVLKRINLLEFLLNYKINDKFAHFVTYASMVIVINFARISFLKNIYTKILFLFAHSVYTEFIQSLLSYRDGSLGDILANLIGLCVGYIIYLLSKYIKLLFK